jgi:rhodanese-related sulfurtransferase
MKKNIEFLHICLITIILVGIIVTTGCSPGAVTTTSTVYRTTTTTAQGTTVTETAQAATVTETAPAEVITQTLPANTSTITTIMTETQPPETTTETATTTITVTPMLQDQVIGMFSAREAYDFIQANAGNPKLLIVDVRDSSEYRDGHIEGAVNWSYNSGIEMQLQNKDRCATYLIVCASGNRSGMTVGIMRNMGFYEVYDIGGGMQAWIANGLPTVQ